MQPNATTGGNRKYSLFSSSSTLNNSSITGIFGGVGNISATSDGKRLFGQRRSADMTGSVCQRCRRFEVDLTNTSDDLNATDAELKASRQVISLLQRQLELFRVEKEGLEKLIISQSNPLQPGISSSSSIEQEQANRQLLEGTSEPSKELDPAFRLSDNSSDVQRRLLTLIKTQLYAKDEEIVKLKFNLKEAQNDKEQLVLQLHFYEEDNARLKNENSVLNENLTLRDQTIVSLSNEVFEQGNLNEHNPNLRRQSNVETSANHQQSLLKSQRHIAKLIDTLDAYKKTNELLSTNVTKLTERCSQAEKKEIETRSQCQELEAKCCQIQSKLLSLLKEIEQSSKQSNQNSGNATARKDENNQDVICSESVKTLIKRLLEDKSLDIPLSWKEGNRPIKEFKEENKSLKYECDELGFYIEVDRRLDKQTSNTTSQKNNEPSSQSGFSENPNSSTFHLATVSELSETANNEIEAKDVDDSRRNVARAISVDSTKNDEARWHIKWDNFIKDFDNVDLSKSKEFKDLLRSGVPQEYRCKVWKALVDLKIGEERRSYGSDYYQSLLEPNRPLNSSKKTLSPASKQIELDLLRTLPNNKHFETLDSSGTVRLRRVLTAYSEHNPKVGYCQGMNRLAAVALLVLPEEEAFWCLATIIDRIMPKGYYNDLWLAQVDSSVVMDYISIKLPNLSNHFRRNNIEISLFAWFLTIFVDGTPPALFLRLWDSFLFEGDKILFRVALALLRMYENQILRLNNSVSINNFLRSTVNAPMDIDQFFDIAFNWINPLSTRSLRTKRQHNFHLMKSSFDAGRSFTTPSPTMSVDDDQDNSNSRNDDSPHEDSSIISV